MAIYYVSNRGCDRSDGLTENSPWKTIEQVNAKAQSGDEVRFRRGDIFYGQLTPPAGLTVSVYGEGKDKPTISQYKFPRADSWKQESDTVWRLDLSNPDNLTGNTAQMDTNVGFLRVDGEIFPRRRFDGAPFERQWDFRCEGQYLDIYCEGNPAELAGEIAIACNIGCVRFANDLRMEEIILRGSGGHGISGTVRGAYIADCEFHELGGSVLPGYPVPNTRYGNGVECWSNSADVTVERCRFSGIYDVAITMQGNGVKSGWENMLFRDNVMWNNQQCFEIWSSGKLPNTGFKNCIFERNVCLDSGWCWSYDVRPNKECAAALLLYGLECPLCDILVRNNVLANSRVAPIYKSGGAGQIPDDYRIVDNTILLAGDQPLNHRQESDEVYRAFYDKIAADNRIFISK